MFTLSSYHFTKGNSVVGRCNRRELCSLRDRKLSFLLVYKQVRFISVLKNLNWILFSRVEYNKNRSNHKLHAFRDVTLYILIDTNVCFRSPLSPLSVYFEVLKNETSGWSESSTCVCQPSRRTSQKTAM